MTFLAVEGDCLLQLNQSSGIERSSKESAVEVKQYLFFLATEYTENTEKKEDETTDNTEKHR